MTWMNEHEIDHAVAVLGEEAPEVARYARYLSDWRDTINENSDGWPYWSKGSKPAERLSDLVLKSMEVCRNRGDHPSEKEFNAALTPIRSFATRHKLPAPTLGEPEEAPAPRM